MMTLHSMQRLLKRHALVQADQPIAALTLTAKRRRDAHRPRHLATGHRDARLASNRDTEHGQRRRARSARATWEQGRSSDGERAGCCNERSEWFGHVARPPRVNGWTFSSYSVLARRRGLVCPGPVIGRLMAAPRGEHRRDRRLIAPTG